MSEKRSALLRTEDMWAVWIGTLVFVLSLGMFAGIDVLGWAAKTEMWTSLSKAVAPVSDTFGFLPGFASLLLTFAAMLAVLTAGAYSLGANAKRFIGAFTGVFWITYLSVILGHYAVIAANSPADMEKFGIPWSLKLTGEAGLILALIAGLVIGNFFPGVARALKEAARPEWYIKTAIVILGAGVAVKAAEALGLASAVMFRGLAAIVEAYLIYWAIVYFIARRYFKFSREWAAPLASGISICGVSAAMATGGAIRARPIVPIMVSSLVVIFAVVEILILPFAAQAFLHNEPLVAAAWMGLAVKTDGAAIASGQMVESLIGAKAAAQGINYKEGWMLMTTTTVKMFIDIFIGIWAFILAIVFCTKIERKHGGRVRAREIWERFPKFVLGYIATFAVMLAILLANPELIPLGKAASGASEVFRKLFFALTFFTIGLVTNFKKLREEGIGKLAGVYVVGLFGFILWIGLFISWVFFNGVKPPLAS